MWIVRLALKRPYTIAVACMLIFLMGILSLRSMLVDIFPVINIPVVGVVWTYNGLSAEDMERRVDKGAGAEQIAVLQKVGAVAGLAVAWPSLDDRPSMSSREVGVELDGARRV